MRISLVLIAVTACGSSQRSAPRAGWSPSVAVPPAALAAIAVAPVPQEDDAAPSWLIVSDDGKVLVPGDLGAGDLVGLPGAGGGPVKLAISGKTEVPYGCDNGKLPVTALRPASAVAPGLVFVVKGPLPAEWQPRAVPVVDGARSPERRTWTAGPLALELVRKDATHATLSVRAGERLLGERSAEKTYMEGAEEAGIDLSLVNEIGMPVPSAVVLLGDHGPALVALATQSYEGMNLATLIVADGVTEAESASAYLYQCAF